MFAAVKRFFLNIQVVGNKDAKFENILLQKDINNKIEILCEYVINVVQL